MRLFISTTISIAFMWGTQLPMAHAAFDQTPPSLTVSIRPAFAVGNVVTDLPIETVHYTSDIVQQIQWSATDSLYGSRALAAALRASGCRIRLAAVLRRCTRVREVRGSPGMSNWPEIGVYRGWGARRDSGDAVQELERGRLRKSPRAEAELLRWSVSPREWWRGQRTAAHGALCGGAVRAWCCGAKVAAAG